MTWLTLLKAMVVAASAFATWLRDRRLIDGARAETLSANLKSALDEIAAANAARDSVRRGLVRDPERLRDDDGFRRPD